MITPIQSNGANVLNNALNVERIRVPRRINFKGTPQTQPTEEQSNQNPEIIQKDTFEKQTIK